MILYERIRKEDNSIQELLSISNNNDYPRCKKKIWDEELIKPWWSDLPPVKIIQHHSSYSDLFQKQHIKPKLSVKMKESRRHSKVASFDLKFFHFDQTKEYITHYRESVTLPSVMEYRKKLLSLTTDKLSLCSNCLKGYSPHDLVKHCHCINADKKTNLNSSSVCYGTDSPVNLPSKSSQSIHPLSPNSLNERRNSASSSHKQLGWKNSSSRSIDQQQRALDNKKAKSSYDRFCTSISLHKKDLAQIKQQKGLTIKTSRNQPLKFFTNSKLNLGPRMGSNYPPSKSKSHSRYQQSSLLNTLRPKIPQAAIPGKSTSFQACIMPTNMSSNDER